MSPVKKAEPEPANRFPDEVVLLLRDIHAAMFEPEPEPTEPGPILTPEHPDFYWARMHSVDLDDVQVRDVFMSYTTGMVYRVVNELEARDEYGARGALSAVPRPWYLVWREAFQDDQQPAMPAPKRRYRAAREPPKPDPGAS